MRPGPAAIRIAVLFGGPSAEHDVSCASAASIIEHLDRDRFVVTPVLVSRDGAWMVGSSDPRTAVVATSLAAAIEILSRMDVLFPAFHGRFGEDGTVQALLDLIGVPYVGSGLAASAAGMDKEWTKILLHAAGLTVADGVTLPLRASLTDGDRDRIGLPAFVKPARAGSSIGVGRVDDWSQLDQAVAAAREQDSKVLVEQAVPGREVDVAVLQRSDGSLICGPPLEIRVGAGGGFFDFDAKYQAGSGTVFDIPADLDPEVVDLLQRQAIQAFRVLGCDGLLRVDFFLRPDGGKDRPVVNEVNIFPGFTAQSQYPRIWQAAGLEFPQLLTVLVETALTKPDRAAGVAVQDLSPAAAGE